MAKKPEKRKNSTAPKKWLKTASIRFWAKEEDKAAWEQAAYLCGKNLSDYLRDRLLGK